MKEMIIFINLRYLKYTELVSKYLAMVKMMLTHFYVTLLDLPECLPFTFNPTGKLEELEKDERLELEAEARLQSFAEQLMNKFGEEFAYIGDDIIGEKFYKRFLLEKNGFMEVMTGVPAVVSAHFTTKERAEKFAEALRKTIEKQVSDEKAKMVLLQAIEVDEDEASQLTFEKWEKLRDIRSTVKD